MEERKNALWGDWRSSMKWRESLHRQATHKALDIPDEMGNIEANRIYGMGWKELAVIVGGLAAAAYFFKPQVETPSAPAVTQPEQGSGAQEEYRPILRPGKPQERQ